MNHSSSWIFSIARNPSELNSKYSFECGADSQVVIEAMIIIEKSFESGLCWARSCSTTTIRMPGTIVQTSEVRLCYPHLFAKAEIPFNSLLILAPSVCLHGRCSRCDPYLIPFEPPSFNDRKKSCASLWNYILVACSCLLMLGPCKLHQNGDEIQQKASACTVWMEDANSELPEHKTVIAELIAFLIDIHSGCCCYHSCMRAFPEH